ncbi:hypothetical protein [Lutispora sp.]|uniref:hypothetical protein n=1 Tax=Lutispora sp. TaxID=2828727 RepID=UPI002B2080D4|nr:hypothetical protein [Lutispora sp.]MEA4962441.1 hypothetical protein [Lutispora sp.]
MRLKRYITILLFIIFIFTGCSKDTAVEKYTESAKKFNTLYFGMIEDIDSSDVMKSLESLQSEDNNNFKQLEEELQIIKNTIPESKEELYDNFKKRYEELVFLKDSYTDFTNLSIDIKRKIHLIIVSIEVNKENWKDKNSTIVWQ